MGGFYKRLVGLVKRSLRKAIGKLCLTGNQLLTVLKKTVAETLIASWKKRLKHLDKYWKVWQNDYVLSL